MACAPRMQLVLAVFFMVAAPSSARITLRQQCKILIKAVENHDDMALDMRCRSGFNTKLCSDMISALGVRPWSQANREAACDRFEGFLHQQRVLVDTPKVDLNDVVDTNQLQSQVQDAMSQGADAAKEKTNSFFVNAEAGLESMESKLSSNVKSQVEDMCVGKEMDDTCKNKQKKFMDMSAAAKTKMKSIMGQAKDQLSSMQREIDNKIDTASTQGKINMSQVNDMLKQESGKLQEAMDSAQSKLQAAENNVSEDLIKYAQQESQQAQNQADEWKKQGEQAVNGLTQAGQAASDQLTQHAQEGHNNLQNALAEIFGQKYEKSPKVQQSTSMSTAGLAAAGLAAMVMAVASFVAVAKSMRRAQKPSIEQFDREVLVQEEEEE